MLREHFGRLLQAIVQAVQSHYGEKLISLAVFGSVARGTMRPDSDVDVLLVIEPLPCGRLARVREFEAVENALGDTLTDLANKGIHTTLAPVIKTRAEVEKGSPLFLDMTDQALILYDKDSFFADYLEQLRERLKTLGAERRYLKGGYYWILKPDLKPGEKISL